MKKILSFILILILLFTSTACTGFKLTAIDIGWPAGFASTPEINEDNEEYENESFSKTPKQVISSVNNYLKKNKHKELPSYKKDLANEDGQISYVFVINKYKTLYIYCSPDNEIESIDYLYSKKTRFSKKDYKNIDSDPIRLALLKLSPSFGNRDLGEVYTEEDVFSTASIKSTGSYAYKNLNGLGISAELNEEDKESDDDYYYIFSISTD